MMKRHRVVKGAKALIAAERRGRNSRTLATIGLGFLLAFTSLGAAQGASGGVLPLTAPESARTRAELLGLLDTVQRQIEAIPNDPTPEESERLGSLNGLLQLLLLQTRLERLQRENATLETQVEGDTDGGSGNRDVAALEARLDAVIREQRAIAQEMSMFSTDHASLLTSVVGTTEAPAPETEAQGAETHAVVAGDSLSSLAQTYLGDANRWPEFLDANPDLTDADALPVGFELVIPAAE